MAWRNYVSFVSLGILGAAILLQFLIPAISGYVFFFLLAWLIVSVGFFFRPTATRGPGTGSTPAPMAPPDLPRGLGFCIYCAAPVAPGAAVCPSCGHALPPS